MHPLGELAVASLALLDDAADGGEVRKVRCVGWPRDDAGATPFVAIVGKLAFLVEGEFAALVSGREGGLHARKQRGVVGFKLQGVMRSGVAHRGGHGGRGIQKINGKKADPSKNTF